MKVMSLSYWSLCFLVVVILTGRPAFATPLLINDNVSTGFGSWSGIPLNGSNEPMILHDTALAERAFVPISAGTYRVAFDYDAAISPDPNPSQVGLLHDFWSFNIVLANLSDLNDSVTFDVNDWENGTHRFEWVFINPFDDALFAPSFLLSNENTTADDSTVIIMNFELATEAAPVPEPGTIMLMGGGVIVLSFALRRRRQH